MRRSRITFLMLAAIGGCTPLAYDQRFQDTPAFQPQQLAVTRQVIPPPSPPTQPQWSRGEQPAPAERFDTASVLTASTNANGTVTSSAAPVKPVVAQVAQVAQLPSQPTPVPPSRAEESVSRYVDKNQTVQQAVYNQTKCDKPGSFAEHTDLDAKTPPLPMQPPLLPATNNVIDLGAGPLVQQPAFRMVNTKKFSLNFEVKDVGVTGISGVDLWCTQDMRTWKKYESMQQVGNALQVEVKEEGVYGFTLVAHNGNGLGKSPPQPGELPQVWVSVDMTPPAVTLAGVEMSLTNKTPCLILRWTAKDRNFGPRPVTLSFASGPDGPWTLMAANVENNGRYEWPLPSTLPATMYIRVQAADLNGNVGFAQTETPIHLDNYTAKTEAPAEAARPATPPPPSADPARPSATILNVEPSQQQ